MLIRKLIALGAFAASVSMAAPAIADPITLNSSMIGQSFTVNYNGFIDVYPRPGLSGQTTFTLTGIQGSSYLFDYSLTNTSSNGATSRISSFGFNADPNITGASSTGDYSYALVDASYPGGLGTIDVCFKSGGQTSTACAGNTGGMTAGQTGSGTMKLDFGTAAAPNAVTLDDFFVRYENVTGQGCGCITTANGTGTLAPTAVPEPGMIGIFGLGLLGLAFARTYPRRRRQAA